MGSQASEATGWQECSGHWGEENFKPRSKLRCQIRKTSGPQAKTEARRHITTLKGAIPREDITVRDQTEKKTNLIKQKLKKMNGKIETC